MKNKNKERKYKDLKDESKNKWKKKSKWKLQEKKEQ